MALNFATSSPKTKALAEWGGCITGMAGAALLASHTAYSGWGFALFLASNAFMLLYGYIANAKGLMLMQVGFTATSVTGIANWLFH